MGSAKDDKLGEFTYTYTHAHTQARIHTDTHSQGTTDASRRSALQQQRSLGAVEHQVVVVAMVTERRQLAPHLQLRRRVAPRTVRRGAHELGARRGSGGVNKDTTGERGTEDDEQQKGGVRSCADGERLGFGGNRRALKANHT